MKTPIENLLARPSVGRQTASLCTIIRGLLGGNQGAAWREPFNTPRKSATNRFGASWNSSKSTRSNPVSPAKLKSIKTEQTGPFKDKDEAKAYTSEINDKIRDLQYRLYVEHKQSLLVILQAPDAAGKDGLIRKVLGRMNPQGCRTYPFKVPSKEEAAHDFLWRIHKCTPGQGNVSVFNRSHYEDVLVVRVEDLVPKKVWSKRYELINHFEENLVAAGTRILKFYLHISPKEQLERFSKRLDNPDKHWKLNVGRLRRP